MLRADIAAAFRLQVRWCRDLGSPFTSGLLEAATGDLETGGALAALVREWPGDPVSDALALRVAGALHALVLEGANPELAAAYPHPGKAGDPHAAWRAAERVIAGDPAGFGLRLRSPPQTNEVRRALGLFPALLLLAGRFAQPMRLYELGASAGLNLLMDAFAYRTSSWSWGDDAAVRIEGDWRGPPPPMTRAPRIVDRSGCDVNPLDAGDPAHRLRLQSYVWADQFDRLSRLRSALELADERSVRVERADAAGWLADQLPHRPRETLSLVYHSVFWQYLPAATQAAITATLHAAGAEATQETPLAWLRLESAQGMAGSRPSGHLVELTVWPGGEHRVLAEFDPHGRWVNWRGEAG